MKHKKLRVILGTDIIIFPKPVFPAAFGILRRTIMTKGLIYLHGKGGSALEAEHYRPLFPGYDIVGFDYQAQTPWEAKKEFCDFLDLFAETHKEVYLLASSLGAYFALQSFPGKSIKKAYFVSPIVNMELLIEDLIKHANVTEQTLREKEIIATDSGETLSWKYLSWVRAHPVIWDIPTEILFGENDHLQTLDAVTDFAAESGAAVTVMEGGEHWFHTKEQMQFLDHWILASQTEAGQSSAKTYEKSCGAVIFRKTQAGLSFVLVYGGRHWGFPKGHIEKGENEKETAIREIKEETSLQVRFISNFRTTDEHALVREGRPNTIKKVVYFLAEFENQIPAPIDHEISEIKLVNYGDALQMLASNSERLKEILCEANDFLLGSHDFRNTEKHVEMTERNKP